MYKNTHKMFRILKANILIILIAVNLIPFSAVSAEGVSFSGQITGWGILQLENPYPTQFGGRFVPTVLGDFSLGDFDKIDFEASANLNGSVGFKGLDFDNSYGEFKPYRIWTRYSGENWELRAGLQKINFGQAKMFRPLMWFDAIDVRDPLQLTDGVTGLLGKYFFKNNANVWFWGLIGNINPKGFEFYATAQWKPEVGGRFQMPLGSGQLALSTNYRKVNVPNLASSIPNNDFELNESRYGLDGKWDVGIGLWFESSLTLTDKQNQLIPTVYKVQDMWNIGADYTLPVANGVGVTVEYFRYHVSEEFLIKGNSLNVLGTMLTYPLSLLDNMSGMVFYLAGQNKWMNYLSWSRTYDNFNIYAIGYWNPSDMQLVANQSQNSNLFAGKGIQLMVNYNF